MYNGIAYNRVAKQSLAIGLHETQTEHSLQSRGVKRKHNSIYPQNYSLQDEIRWAQTTKYGTVRGKRQYEQRLASSLWCFKDKIYCLLATFEFLWQPSQKVPTSRVNISHASLSRLAKVVQQSYFENDIRGKLFFLASQDRRWIQENIVTNCISLLYLVFFYVFFTLLPMIACHINCTSKVPLRRVNFPFANKCWLRLLAINKNYTSAESFGSIGIFRLRPHPKRKNWYRIIYWHNATVWSAVPNKLIFLLK